MEFLLNYENFVLKVKPEIFEDDMYLPVNTIMEVMVQSADFSAFVTMDIAIKDLVQFAFDLTQIYKTLSGEARIEEPYGTHMFISFAGDGKGHVTVKGHLNDSRNEHILEFQNAIDQTCLKKFAFDLFNTYKKL